ncbi:MAG: hypothetical protein AAGE76_03350 [Pseudomonadota bacterium]
MSEAGALDTSPFVEVSYGSLSARQKENFNFHQVAARLAHYGFPSMRLSDDWQGADFLACHVDGETILRVQLKGRLSIDRKYVGKKIHIAFVHDEDGLPARHLPEPPTVRGTDQRLSGIVEGEGHLVLAARPAMGARLAATVPRLRP